MLQDKKLKSVAEAVAKIMGEDLKGKQHKIDANHNNKIDAEDFKILRGQKKVKEEVEQIDESGFYDTLSSRGAFDKEHHPQWAAATKDWQKKHPKLNKQRTAEIKSQIKGRIARGDYKKSNLPEETEQIIEGKMEHMSLSHLWHKHGEHAYIADQGYGEGGSADPKRAHQAATAIENHVRKHYGNKVADDMVHHSELRTTHSEYAQNDEEAKDIENAATKLRKKHNIKGDIYGHSTMKESRNQIDEVKLADLPVRKVSGTKYGGESQKDEPEEDDEDMDDKPKKAVKKGTFKRRYNTKAYKESFTGMMTNLQEQGLGYVAELMVTEEPTNDEYTAEVKDAQAKSEGKGKKAEVAKPLVQAVKNEEVEQIEERTLSSKETKKKEEVVKSMKKKMGEFRKRYGSRGKEVMYATATKVAKGSK